MCPNPGMILNITATASLALPSAVSVALRFQSHRSQASASFGRRCPQNGQGILSPALDSGRVAGASVYSTFISNVECCRAFAAANASSLKVHKPRGIRQENLTTNGHELTRIFGFSIQRKARSIDFFAGPRNTRKDTKVPQKLRGSSVIVSHYSCPLVFIRG